MPPIRGVGGTRAVALLIYIYIHMCVFGCGKCNYTIYMNESYYLSG